MKKAIAILLVVLMALSIVACGKKEEAKKDYSGYTIRIYSNSNSTERVTWLIEKAKEAGFTISLDTNEVYSGDSKAVRPGMVGSAKKSRGRSRK